jgi:hypothetical protein
MRVDELRLSAPPAGLHELSQFYSEGFGLATETANAQVKVQVGSSTLLFRGAVGEPFYHYAFLVSASEFDRAVTRLSQATPLLLSPETGQVIFDFDFWDACACYALDPVGNIVELIAHRDLDVDPVEGGVPVEISEIGLVCDDKPAVAAALKTLAIEVFDGTVEATASLAFAGTKGRAFVLAPRGRGWLPTSRPAEVHPVEALVLGAGQGRVEVPGLPYRVTAR